MEEKPVVASMSNEIILSIEDLQREGSKKLPAFKRGKQPFPSLLILIQSISLNSFSTSLIIQTEFFNSGSTGQITVHENSTAYLKYRLRTRVLRDVSKADTSTIVLGKKISFPLCVSPAGIQAMAHPDGELATSRACAKRGINMGVSSYSNYSVEEVIQAGKEVGDMAHVMQLYTMKDRAMEERIIKLAEAAGCKAIFLTADSPVLGVRYNEWKNDFRTPDGLGFPMIERTTEQIMAQMHDSGFMAFNSDSHSWDDDIPWIRSRTKMEIWIKGCLLRRMFCWRGSMVVRA